MTAGLFLSMKRGLQKQIRIATLITNQGSHHSPFINIICHSEYIFQGNNYIPQIRLFKYLSLLMQVKMIFQT